MRAWWSSLSERERWILMGGSALALVVLLYTLIWRPFQTHLKELRQAVAQQRMDLTWMRQAAKEIKGLANTGSASTTPGASAGRSLLTLIDQTAKAAGLGSAVKRVEPQGEDQLRVQMEQVSFDKMILWLGALKQEHGVETVNVTVDRHSESGQVNARLILQGLSS